MIRKVSFRNFKAYRSLDLELEPFTVLVGPNASGKTTLLEGLYLLSASAQYLMPGNKAYFPMPVKVRSHGVSTSAEIHVTGDWKGDEGSVRAASGAEPQRDENGVVSLP